MKNLIILSFVLSFLFFASCGDDNGSDPTDTPDISLVSYDTLLTTYTDNYEQLSTSPVIKNIDDEAINVIIEVEKISLPEGHTFKVCYGDDCTQFITDDLFTNLPVTIAAGETIPEGKFQITYNGTDAEGNPVAGTGEFLVRILNEDNDEDMVEFNIVFDVKPPVFELVDPDTEVSGSVLSQDELLSYCQVKNNTNEEIKVKARMEVISLVDGHMLALCTDICYAYTDQDFTAPGPLIIPANGITEPQTFSGHYNHTLGGGIPNAGTSEIKYIFYLEDNPDITKEYTCTFTVE